MRLTTSFAAIVLATGTLTMTTADPGRAVETCFGLAPTIVTSPGEGELKATEGDDVIVDTHGRWINSLGGNDAICSVGSGYIDAGDGDDKVSLVDAEKGVLVVLGSGSDLYEGSEVRDRVMGSGVDSTERLPGDPGDVDTISTYGGDDLVHSGFAGMVNDDVIDLGPGPDRVKLGGAGGGTAAVMGGDGRDDDVELDTVGPGDLVVDLGAGTVALDGEAVVGLVGFEDASVFARRVTLVGTSGSNDLSASTRGARVSGLGGSDLLRVDGCGAVARGDGGADKLLVSYRGCNSDPVMLYGGAGNDVLRGGQRRDVLIGNGGRDSARGGKERDVCRAEIERACERG